MQSPTTKNLYTFVSTTLLLIVSCVIAENLQSPPTGTMLIQPLPSAAIDLADQDRMTAEKRSSWNNLHSSWGKRRSNVVDDILAARLLNNLANDVDRDTLNDLLVNELLEASRLDDEMDEAVYRPGVAGAVSAEKRAWKNMNGAWGKRVSNGDWNKFRGKITFFFSYTLMR